MLFGTEALLAGGTNASALLGALAKTQTASPLRDKIGDPVAQLAPPAAASVGSIQDLMMLLLLGGAASQKAADAGALCALGKCCWA